MPTHYPKARGKLPNTGWCELCSTEEEKMRRKTETIRPLLTGKSQNCTADGKTLVHLRLEEILVGNARFSSHKSFSTSYSVVCLEGLVFSRRIAFIVLFFQWHIAKELLVVGR